MSPLIVTTLVAVVELVGTVRAYAKLFER